MIWWDLISCMKNLYDCAAQFRCISISRMKRLSLSSLLGPGTTEIFGSCGTAGGIPKGCHGDYSGKFGDCCTDHCDAWALGKNAEEYDWPNAPVTTWHVCNHFNLHIVKQMLGMLALTRRSSGMSAQTTLEVTPTDYARFPKVESRTSQRNASKRISLTLLERSSG